MRAWKNLCLGKSNKMKLRRIKKAQEEMVGFVLIVVIVAVIFLVFLAIFARRTSPVTQRENIDVSQYMTSMMHYTTDCAVRYEPDFSDIARLISDCYSDAVCVSGEMACNALKRTLGESIEANWKIGPDRPTKGYIFNSTYKSGQIAKEIVSISAGNCSSSAIGAEYAFPAPPGSIISTLTICN